MAKLQVNFKNISFASEEVIKQVLIQTADDIIKTVKELAPVDTGSLRASYIYSVESPTRIIVGSLANIINPKTKRPATEYAAYVEYGTDSNVAQPHFVPAFELARIIFETRLKEAMRKIVNK